MGKKKSSKNSNYTEAIRQNNKKRIIEKEEKKKTKKVNHWLKRYENGIASEKEIKHLKKLSII